MAGKISLSSLWLEDSTAGTYVGAETGGITEEGSGACGACIGATGVGAGVGVGLFIGVTGVTTGLGVGVGVGVGVGETGSGAGTGFEF
jgi:hypothetical protein